MRYGFSSGPRCASICLWHFYSFVADRVYLFGLSYGNYDSFYSSAVNYRTCSSFLNQKYHVKSNVYQRVRSYKTAVGLGSGALDSARSWFGFAFWSLLSCVWSFLSSSGVVGTHAANRALLHLITFSLFEFLDLLVVVFLFFENIPRVRCNAFRFWCFFLKNYPWRVHNVPNNHSIGTE